MSKSSREMFRRLAQPKITNSVQITKKKPEIGSKSPYMQKSMQIKRDSSKESIRLTQSKVYRVQNMQGK